MAPLQTKGERLAAQIAAVLRPRLERVITPDEARDRIQRRRDRKARLKGRDPRNSLIDFTQHTYEGYEAQWFHHLIADELEQFFYAVKRKESPRLAIFVPVRHGKSELASRRFAPWVLGHEPDWFIIHSTYNQTFAEDFSYEVRGILKEPSFQEVFPEVKLAKDSQALDKWRIQGRRGIYAAVGVGGTLTGRGAHVLVIDDPVKGPEEADSELERKKGRNWYDAAARTRLMPGGGVLLIQTRWNQADLGGYLTEGRGSEKPISPDILKRWRKIVLPAIAERDEEWTIYKGQKREFTVQRKAGEALWPEAYSLEYLAELRDGGVLRWFLALYQQRPVALGGNMLLVEKIRHAIRAREGLRVYQAWDLAISLKKTADYTVCVTIGVDQNNQVYLLDVFRDRVAFHDMLDKMAELADIWDPVAVGIESVGFQSVAFQEANRTHFAPWREIAIGPPPEKPDGKLHVNGDKVVRAQLLEAKIAAGLVAANKQHELWSTVEDEMSNFPTGDHDDIVDAWAYAVHLAAEMGGRRRRANPINPGAETFETNEWGDD